MSLIMNTENAGTVIGPADSGKSEFEALNRVIGALQPLDDDARRRIIDATVTFLRIRQGSGGGFAHSSSVAPTATFPAAHAPFSENTEMPPKEFLLEKQPRTDVERIACLAY